MGLVLASLAGLWFIGAPVGMAGSAGTAWAADGASPAAAPDAKSAKTPPADTPAPKTPAPGTPSAGAPEAAAPTAGAAGSGSTTLGSFGDWQARTMPQQGVMLCYMSSTPQNESPAFAARGATALLVTHAEKGAARDQVSVILGFEPRKGTAVSLKIGKRSFTLQKIAGDRAWSSSDAQDRQIVAAMKKNDSLALRATTAKGRTGEDRYSLSGFTAAYDKITDACGL
ncbi:MAG TPA: invasion associated locus B family protein [Dongiaceae bacterium]|nr:invasion associated locus B family protein [Dongiaceae bacterium]